MASMHSMTIGNSSKSRARRAAVEDAQKNSKQAILARKRERWKVQKEVYDAQQKFSGAGQRLGLGSSIAVDNARTTTSSSISLPGAIESPPVPHPHHRRSSRRRYQRTDGVSETSTTALSHLADNDILTQLTERIASRLKVELRHEVEDAKYDEATKVDVTNKINSFLQNELQQHTCPVCFEAMIPPERSPMLLFPCGHTFCEQCINRQKKIAKHQCPFCRAKIERIAINHSRKFILYNLFVDPASYFYLLKKLMPNYYVLLY